MTNPNTLTIAPRRLQDQLPDPLPRYWHGGSAFKSHFFNAMSVLFPKGERFFIDSVRHYRERADGTALAEQIRGFIGQEAHHSNEHIKYNERLQNLGYDIAGLERALGRRIGFAQKHLPKRRQLAATVGVEHLTAIMADALLTHPQWMDKVDPTMRQLWHWHALEETEHKAVAFDLYRLIGGGETMRRLVMIEVTLFFTYDVTKGLLHMLKKDGLLFNWATWKEGWRFLWGREGILKPIIRPYLDYYRRGFHPWDHDNRTLMQQYQAQFAPAAPNAA
nr:metal-dependent hydrolase [Atopomonas sediminilitoris]